MSPLLVAALLSATPIDAVVVYPDRALVTRATAVECGARKVLAFGAITPAASLDSFRASVEGGTVDGLRVERKVRTDALSAELKDLETKAKALEREMAALNDERSRASARLLLGQQLLQVASASVEREMAADRPDVKAWATAFDAALAATTQGQAAIAEADSKLREAHRRTAELQQKLEGLKDAAAREELNAEVVVSCPSGQKARVELSYLVGGAGWGPSYEARADEASAAVDLAAYATLKQTTGENWENVLLKLSTAIPAQNATPPELKRLFVSASERAPEKKVLTRRDESVEVAEAKPADSAGSEGGALTIRAQGLSVQLEIPQRSSVQGNGTAQRLFVARHRLKASFGLRSVPRSLPVAFRTAELVNTAPFPLLAGELSVFRSTGLVARYPLERVAEGAVFHLTFGVDDAVRIKRVVIEEVKRDAGLFNTKKRFSYAYRFEVQSFQKNPTELELWEGLPVSELDDVTVSVAADKTTAGYQLNAQDGIAKWKVKLKPSEQKNVELTYKVEVPNSYELGGDL